MSASEELANAVSFKNIHLVFGINSRNINLLGTVFEKSLKSHRYVKWIISLLVRK